MDATALGDRDAAAVRETDEERDGVVAADALGIDGDAGALTVPPPSAVCDTVRVGDEIDETLDVEVEEAMTDGVAPPVADAVRRFVMEPAIPVGDRLADADGEAPAVGVPTRRSVAAKEKADTVCVHAWPPVPPVKPSRA